MINIKPMSPEETKEHPIESIEDYMNLILNLKINRFFKFGNFYLFRGMPTDKFELVGRINYDKRLLRKLFLNRLTSNFNYVEAVEKPIFISFKDRARIF